jgi:hypothetical protein
MLTYSLYSLDATTLRWIISTTGSFDSTSVWRRLREQARRSATRLFLRRPDGLLPLEGFLGVSALSEQVLHAAKIALSHLLQVIVREKLLLAKKVVLYICI